MATTITDGSLSNATASVGRSNVFDQAITITGVAEFEDQYLAIGWPFGTAGSTSYFSSQSSSLQMLRGGLDITNRPKLTTDPSDSSENQDDNRNHTFRNGAGVDLEDMNVYIRGQGADIDHRFGFGSPTLGTDPMRLVGVSLYADNVRLIMQLNHFTPDLTDVGIDDFTFSNARADWNVKPGVFTGLASGSNSDTDVNNGNVSGQNAGTALGGTTYFPGYIHRRRAGSDPIVPNAPHRTSLKGLYFVYLDPQYLIIEDDLSLTSVLLPDNLQLWNEAFSSADTASGQRGSVGTGCLVANRFAVEMRNALGGTPQGLRTWVTNADNSAFNTIQCYNLANSLTTTASTNTSNRPSVRAFTLSTPIIDNAVIAISAGVTDTVESLGSGVLNYNIGADYGFITSVYGYAKVSVQNVNPLELNILRRLSGQELNYVVPINTLFSEQVTSLNAVVSRIHNTDIIQAPLVASGWNVNGNTLDFGTATITIGDTSGAFTYTTGDDAININFDVLEDTRTANEAGIGSLLTLNELSGANVVITGTNTGSVAYVATTLITFDGTADLANGTFTAPTAQLSAGTSVTGATTWNFTTINGWEILNVTGQNFAGTTTINTSGVLGNWTQNTYGANTAISIDSSFDATQWDVGDSQVVTFTSSTAVEINLTTIQLASNRYVAGNSNVTLVSPAVQATIVRVDLGAVTNGSVYDIYRDHSNVPVVSGTISSNNEIVLSSAVSSGGTGTLVDPFALSTAVDLDIYYTKDDRSEFRYTHTITTNVATEGQDQVYDVSTAITAASEASVTPGSTINIDDKASPSTGVIDANGRILMDPTQISPLDVVDNEAVYGRILAITRGSSTYLTALRLQDLHFNRTLPSTGLSGGIFQFLGQTNVNMRGATMPGGSDGFYKFVDMEAELQLFRGIYDSGQNFEPRSSDRDRLMICTDGAFGTDQQQVHTMIRQLISASQIATTTTDEFVAEGWANKGVNDGDSAGVRLDVSEIVGTK